MGARILTDNKEVIIGQNHYIETAASQDRGGVHCRRDREYAQTDIPNGYPTFILIDENGIIEQVQEGYTKEFLDQFM